VRTANSLRAQLHLGGMPIGAAQCGEGAATLAAGTLSSLEALPWFAPSGLAASATPSGDRPAGRGRMLLLPFGLAAALTVLGGGAWYAAGDADALPAPAGQQAQGLQGNTLALFAPIAEVEAGDAAAQTGQRAAEAQQIPINEAAKPQRAAAATQVKHASSASDLARTTAAATTPAAGPALAANTGISAAAPPAAPSDSPATSATLRQYRAAMDECRDAIRAIIRLGDRQRPGRSASAEEQFSYRLRQQNAQTAQTYRAYLDEVARTMRGTNSETLTRQSLERARQTRAYLNTLLADSKAVLR
jgi:hypothetical protein